MVITGKLLKNNGGADRDRTDDLLNAIQALSQLSYIPTGFLAVPVGSNRRWRLSSRVR